MKRLEKKLVFFSFIIGTFYISSIRLLILHGLPENVQYLRSLFRNESEADVFKIVLLLSIFLFN